MANYNIKIALTKLPGAKVMDIKGERETRHCVCIPIDDKRGTVYESYKGKGKDGMAERKYLNDVNLNLVAFEFKKQMYGHTHGLKISVNEETLAHTSEEELKSFPIIGNLTPWGIRQDAEAQPVKDDENGNW